MATAECPGCGLPEVATDSCPRCGVVLAKFRSRPARGPSPARPARPAGKTQATGWVLPLVVALAVLAVVSFWLGRRSRRAESVASALPAHDAVRPEPPEAPPPPPLPAAPAEALSVQMEAPPPAAGLSPADREAVDGLVQLVGNPRQAVGAADLRRGEELASRHPEQDGLRTLVAALHLRLAAQERAARNVDSARQHAQQAAADGSLAPQAFTLLMNLGLESSDWAGAEVAARQLLERKPSDLEGQRGLAYALFRQDRNRDATQVLEALLSSQEDLQARALLARIRKLGEDERGMTQQRLAHFNVRYDGGEHEDVGREILRALERHYATLRSQLDHDVAATIPVILFSQQSYYLANGMPAWAGGHYDDTDGRIRVPIGGLSSSLSPDLDGTLLHELTHAFVADRSRGLAPRELHEGLAQYMEGKRVEELLGREQLAALADGGARGVGGFYLEALAFVEYLMRLRGQGGINDLLAGMGQSGSVDQAFTQIYGRDFAGTQAEWRQRFQRAEGR